MPIYSFLSFINNPPEAFYLRLKYIGFVSALPLKVNYVERSREGKPIAVHKVNFSRLSLSVAISLPKLDCVYAPWYTVCCKALNYYVVVTAVGLVVTANTVLGVKLLLFSLARIIFGMR